MPGGEPGAGIADILSSDRWLRALLLIAAALAIGQGLQWVAVQMSVTVPAFLTAMFGGVILTNLADLVRHPVDFELADLVSTVALRLFLAMAMLSLKLWVLLAFVGLLSAMLVAQIAVVVLVASLLVFPLMGRDRQAAVAAGGFIGFALGAMPVGLGTMRRLSGIARAGAARVPRDHAGGEPLRRRGQRDRHWNDVRFAEIARDKDVAAAPQPQRIISRAAPRAATGRAAETRATAASRRSAAP